MSMRISAGRVRGGDCPTRASAPAVQKQVCFARDHQLRTFYSSDPIHPQAPALAAARIKSALKVAPVVAIRVDARVPQQPLPKPALAPTPKRANWLAFSALCGLGFASGALALAIGPAAIPISCLIFYAAFKQL